MKDKQFKNLDEQIQIFKSKGLIIDDEEYAKQVAVINPQLFLK